MSVQHQGIYSNVSEMVIFFLMTLFDTWQKWLLFKKMFESYSLCDVFLYLIKRLDEDFFLFQIGEQQK